MGNLSTVNTIMNTKQIDAILQYLEFNLLSYVENSEQHITDPDVIGDMYDRAYSMLTDFQRTLDMQFLIDIKDSPVDSQQ